ncbi:MAG: lytic transglycosylase domain-containing protein [Thermoanaerobaculia bacterium]|nr:lytic transglycosylase domain-containing protein [Thermoanaerobaculia bacterium]
MRAIPFSLVVLFAGASLVAAEDFGSVKMERRDDGVLVLTNNPDRPGIVRRSEGAAPSVAPAELRDRISFWARQRRLDPALVEAVVRVESAFRPSATSHKGAMGLMQLMPDTARELGVRDAYDVDDNLRGGTTYLRRMIDRFGGDLRLALAGYNAGPEAVERYRGVPPYRETSDYVARVLSLYGAARTGSSTITVGGSSRTVRVPSALAGAGS